MSDVGPLIVPVQVQAMMVNDPSVDFVRAAMNYGQLASFLGPSPAPFQNDAGSGFAADTAAQGVYLMWTLPAALRRGQQQADASFAFPLVPSRWLVVRVYRPRLTAPATGAPQITSWVVQSDYVDSTDATSTYIDPTVTTQLAPTLIGRKVQITAAAPWQEPAKPGPAFLRAVAESNPAFTGYQPFNENVFSFFDDLGTQKMGAGSVSYFVLGWFPQAAADILASWQTGPQGKGFADWLAELSWTAAAPLQNTSKTSLYQGGVFAVPWQPAPSANSSPKDSAVPRVAVGSTSVDAVTAFARAAFKGPVPLPAGLTPDQAAALLEAFQYNLLPMLGSPGADEFIEQQIRAQWFASTQAGTRWSIVDAEMSPGAAPSPPPSAAELATEAAWLATLNANQASFDQTARDRVGLQRLMYEIWWKKGVAQLYYQQSGSTSWPWNVTGAKQFDDALAKLAAQVRTLNQQLGQLAPLLPEASPTAPLTDAIAAFARCKQLPDSRVLKAMAEPRFWAPRDPVAVVSGTAHALHIDPDGLLACRWPGERVTALRVSAAAAGGPTFTVDAAQLATLQAAVPSNNLPAIAPELFAEFLLLDPANASILASAARQTLTADQITAVAASMSPPAVIGQDSSVPAILPPTPWSQPWQPVYLDWEIAWYSIPFQRPDGKPNWAFNGLDYDLVPGALPMDVSPSLLQGRVVLTPKPSFELRSRITQFVTDYPDSAVTSELKAIDGLIETVNDWDFLSQSLGGLDTQLAGWSPIATANPDNVALPQGDTMGQLIGSEARMPPNPVTVDPPRDPTVPPSLFEGIRAGQFYVNRLTVVDAFGQTLAVVNPPTPQDPLPRTSDRAVFHPLIADGLAPTQTVDSREPLRFVQLPPRVLQPGRLNFRFVPPHDDSSDDNPIIGWVLPSHLDSGLAVYGRNGTAYGELRLGVNAAGDAVVGWVAAPGSPLPLLPDRPHAKGPLEGFLANLLARGAVAFGDFLQAVDETLWTVDPLGNRADTHLSVVVGRPLALVRATLAFELQSQAWCDSDWPYTFASPRPTPLFVRAPYRFPVRLGDLGYRQDGLIGYFRDGDYDTFHAMHMPIRGPGDPPLCDYFEAIVPGQYIDLAFAASGLGTPATVTMIMDPRGSVHAQTGIFPVKEITLPPKWVDAALTRMAVTFRAGPVLVAVQTVVPPGQSQPLTSLLLTAPAVRTGTWSWLESDGHGGWPETALTSVDGSARFSSTPPTLREGLLRLTGAIPDT